MMAQACKKRRVYISSESGDSDTDSDVEGSKLSRQFGVPSISTCQHHYKVKAASMKSSRMIRLCGNIVRKLIDHKGGWLFKEPVDPVLYRIPDYFDVIRNPMDLGTVKNKLTKKQYASIEEFAADVRLTFSNAMKYNPPENDVHKVAKELNVIFDSEWESVQRKFRGRNPTQEQQTTKVIKVRAIMDSKSTVAREPVACSNSKPLVARGPVTGSNLIAKKTLTDALSSKVKIKFSVRSSEHTSSKDVPVQAAGSKEGSLNHSVPTGNKEASLNCALPFVKENAKISRIRETEGSSGSIGNESWSCNDTSTSPLASSAQGEESYLHDEPLSPSKALRAAMLRSRFAGTIVKAQQKALLDHGKNIDPVKLQLEKERLEKRQQEEKARIEAQVKAAEAAAQRKFDEEMRMKREREREAARLALRMMKKTVDIDNSDFLKELENFSETWQSNTPGKLIVDFIDGDLPPGLGSPLERLGLFMKNDFEDEVELEMEDSASPSMDVDMRKDSQEDIGHEMQDSISPVTVIGMKNDSQGAEGHEMEDSLPSTVIDTKKDSEEETEHEMVDSVSPLMDVDTEEGEISC
ncbi:transcription factor GTE12-like [Miscanthus floridulus]|uniref:transcription factor GTE12-like n=1 Tax=Miscanthus floridulus TaxID=154761 RepID=UPI0034595EF0